MILASNRKNQKELGAIQKEIHWYDDKMIKVWVIDVSAEDILRLAMLEGMITLSIDNSYRHDPRYPKVLRLFYAG